MARTASLQRRAAGTDESACACRRGRRDTRGAVQEEESERERERGHVPVDVLQQTAGGPPISEMTPGQRDATPCVVRVDSATSSKRPRDDNAEVRICMFNRAEPEDRLAEAPVAGVGTLAVV